MPSARITTPYLELGEEFGLAGGADDQGEFEYKPYLVSFGDRGDFINQLSGTTRVSGANGGRWVNTSLPYQLPDNPRLYYRSCSWKPEGAMVPGAGPIQYTHAVVTALFRQPEFNWQASDDPGDFNSLDPGNEGLLYCTQELDFAKEWMDVPNSSVKFKKDSVVIKGAPAQRAVTVITMTLTYHRYPVIPMTLCRYYTDSVNDATFLGCPKGTVKFLGPSTTRDATTDGTVTQKVRFTYQYRYYDWNMKVRDDGLSWDYVVDRSYAGGATGNSDQYCKYRYMDYSQLLLGSAQVVAGVLAPPTLDPPPDTL